jgi:hypothetical protein
MAEEKETSHGSFALMAKVPDQSFQVENVIHLAVAKQLMVLDIFWHLIIVNGLHL